MKRKKGSVMKKVLLIVVAICSLLGCSPKVNIDYGDSEIYTKNDIDEAIKVINTLDPSSFDVSLNNYVYMGDERATEESIIEYANDLGHAKNLIGENETFTQVLILTCTYKTGKKGNAGQPPNKTYNDWQIYLARLSRDSDWVFLTWGLG